MFPVSCCCDIFRFVIYHNFNFSLSGYSDAGTIQYVDDQVISDVQNFIKLRGSQIINGKVDYSLFMGDLYHDNPEEFEFNLGERRQMISVAAHAKKIIEENEQIATKKRKIDYNEVVYFKTLNGYLFKKKSTIGLSQMDVEVLEPNEQELKLYLFESMVHTLEKSIPEDWDSVKDIVSMSMAFVEIRGKHNVHGEVQCILCQQNNRENRINVSTKKSVQKGQNHAKIYWVMSNFKEHLKQVHLLKDRNKRDVIMPKIENTAQKQTLTVKNEVIYENELQCDSLTQSENQFDGEKKKLKSNTKSVDEYSEEYVDVIDENIVYQQLSEQIGQMSTFVHTQKLIQQKMNFAIENDTRTMKIVKMKDDGSCLFRDLCHQLFPDMKPNSVEFEKFVKKLRTEAVEFIKTNYKDFKRQLANSIYERQIDGDCEVDDMEEKCRDFLENDLPKSTCWAGCESVVAISNLYKVNIIVFNENEHCYYVSGFNFEYKKSICIAYRLSKNSCSKSNKPKGKRNHYDSITDIDDQDIFDLSEIMKSRMNGEVIELEVSTVD